MRRLLPSLKPPRDTPHPPRIAADVYPSPSFPACFNLKKLKELEAIHPSIIYPHDGNWKESSQGLLVTINYTRALPNHHYNERVKQVVLDRMKKGNILHM
ncbi:unnamed protein product [Lactuca virosa]|uniref:Uncharacterized protein n=1 Tax=Lactuca virosa TaxID=75947 RepID=A0AAU9PQK0_9ASTR|nr:unnamed protein product [Lactuca virosa]